MSFLMRKLLLILLPFTLFFGCKQASFSLELPGSRNVIHRESGLYVHREVELRVNAGRLKSPPAGAAPGAVSELDASHFFPLGTMSASFIPSKYERRGDDLVWREVIHLSDYAYKGRTSIGATVRWEKKGAVTVKDALEIFQLPPPETSQIDNWGPWVEASRRRGGIFAWHAEANKRAPEALDPPFYPFRMRFRLVLSKRMYP